MNEFIAGNLNTLVDAVNLFDSLGRNSEAAGLRALHHELTLLCAAPTQGADARPVADAREALTDAVVEKWLDRQGNDSGQGLCDMYTSAVRDGYRLARSTLTDFYATRDAAPSEAISDVLAERERQDAQWGGQDHDDQHTKADWQNYIYRQHYAASSFCGTPEQYRVRLVKIAALAVAAIESIDRLAASAPREET